MRDNHMRGRISRHWAGQATQPYAAPIPETIYDRNLTRHWRASRDDGRLLLIDRQGWAVDWEAKREASDRFWDAAESALIDADGRGVRFAWRLVGLLVAMLTAVQVLLWLRGGR